MPRKLKAVSLGGRQGDRVARGYEDATPERLGHARRNGLSQIDGQGMRRVGDPFDLLHARNLLDRESPAGNALLWQAGDRLRDHWHLARLDGTSSVDFGRPFVDGRGPGAGTSPTEAALRHREAFRTACDAVGGRLKPYLVALVIEARTVADLRSLVTDTSHARTADALVLERLREGLHRLCDLWRMRSNDKPRPVGSWRDDTAHEP